ncbi:MAG: enoyl-CoA hydratase/isomerase family protein [Deltaproteobacteria bacterium]|nr:enoyl-CoA hydratase/isomerase family protein [Deltaproteobacteria bacterium]
MAYDTILVEQKGAVALITLNRPKALNALNRQLITELLSVYDALIAGGTTRSAVLTGAGDKAFAAGADITEMNGQGPADMAAFSALGHRMGARIETAPFPTIAAVNGFALGGGCELALSADFIHAAEEAKFGQPEVNLGLIPGFGGCTRLVRRVGVAWARELVETGDPISAAEALRIGLCNRVVPRAQLLEGALKTAQRIADRGPCAVRAARDVLLQTQDLDLVRANAFEMTAFGLVSASADSQEGMTAFVEKRPAKFQGK